MGTQTESGSARNVTPEVLLGVVGVSARLREAAAQVPRIAQSGATCLLLGETGTGKELFARAIHYLSKQARKPFVPLNCGAISDALFENELFGHVRGAYTDASTQNPGLLAFAEDGTLFLDEVDALSPSAQVKLLRVLQEKEYRPVGSAKVVRTEARVLAASNCDLADQVQRGRFREDLYYRLNVLRLTIPPLRHRVEDIPVLAAYFAKGCAASQGRPVPQIEPDAMQRLMAHRWPGNVRELQAVLHRAVLLAKGTEITVPDLDLPELARTAHASAAGLGTLMEAKVIAIEQFERAYLAELLQTCQGNVSRAAQVAGKERRCFQRLLRKYQIASAAFRSC